MDKIHDPQSGGERVIKNKLKLPNSNLVPYEKKIERPKKFVSVVVLSIREKTEEKTKIIETKDGLLL